MSERERQSVGAAVAAAGFARGMIDAGRPRLYLAGPMSGLPDLNYPMFNKEAMRLRELGYHVENPAETPTQESWGDYMRHAIAKMMTCDQVALLPGWERSAGASMEYDIAKRLGMPCGDSCVVQSPASDSVFA